MSNPLFEVINQEEFLESQRHTKEYATEPRTFTTWFKLPHYMGMCEVPQHDEIQAALKPDQQAVRQRFPVRMVFTVNSVPTCRDCFMEGYPR